MRKRFTARTANGAVSAAIVAFFLVHSSLGAIAALTGFASPLSALVWVGVALIGVHVILSVVTSAQQLGDKERPPSARKKRHLALKWVTGGLLAATATAHVVVMRVYGAGAVQSSVTGALLTLALVAILAVHVCVGAKSLLKDLGIDRRHKAVFRAVVIAACVIVSIAVVVAVAR